MENLDLRNLETPTPEGIFKSIVSRLYDTTTLRVSRTDSVESVHSIGTVPLTLEWKSTVSSESVYSLVASANSGSTAFSLVVASAVARYILVNAGSGRVGDKGRYGGTGQKGKA